MNELKRLLGTWRIDPEDKVAARILGRVTVTFYSDGRLIYKVHGAKKDDVILMTYEVEGDVIVTNQPSSPRIERTPFEITADDRLILTYGNQKSIFVRLD
jgi:hypothetical protein